MSFHDTVATALAEAPTKVTSFVDLGGAWTTLVNYGVKKLMEADLAGPDKKAALMQALAAWLDRVLPNLPLPWWLSVLRPFLLPFLRSSLLAIAEGSIEAAYSFIKEHATP